MLTAEFLTNNATASVPTTYRVQVAIDVVMNILLGEVCVERRNGLHGICFRLWWVAQNNTGTHTSRHVSTGMNHPASKGTIH